MAKITALPVVDAMDGDELLPIVQGGDTKRATMSAFRDLITPFLQYWYRGDKGETGAADNTYVSRGLLRASDVTRRTASLVGDNFAPDGRFNYETGAAPYMDDDGLTTLVPEGDTKGAWVRQRATGLSVRGVVAKDAQARFDELEVVMPFAPGDTPEQILAKGQAAIDFAPAGSTVVIPKGDWLCSTSKMSLSWLIAKRLTLRVDGRVRMSDGTRRDDPPCLLRVTAANVTVQGNGTLQGAGTFDSVNDPASQTFPRLIDITGDSFKLTGIALIDAPKVGVFLRNARRAELSSARFEGGPLAYEGVGHMHIRTEGGSSHRITRNDFGVNAAGGKASQCIFSGGPLGATDCLTVSSNRATAYEKLAYLYGDRHAVTDNEIYDCLKTDVVRIHGSYCLVRGNFGDNVYAVCTIYDAHDVTVERNEFTNLKQGGIAVFRDPLTDYAGTFNNTKILNNKLHADPAFPMRQRGIDFYIDGQNQADGVDIIGNDIRVFADDNDEGLIRVMGANSSNPAAAATPTRVRVNSNVLSNAVNGIIVRHCARYQVRQNSFDSMASWPIVTSDSLGGTFSENVGLGSLAVKGISGLSDTDVAYGNQWTASPVSLKVTMSAGDAQTFAHDGLAPNAFVQVTPINNAARLLAGAPGPAAVSIAGDYSSFTIALPNGGSYAGGEQFRADLIQ